MPPRGWIIPVGGCRSSLCRSGVEPPTGTIHPRQISLRNSKSEKTSPAMNLLIDSYFLSSVQCPRVDGSFRSGVQPPTGSRPESSTPAKYFSTISKSGKTSPAINLPIDSYFLSSVQCPRVGGSFRSGVQPPTGSRPESSTPAEYLSAIPNPKRHPPR